MVEESLLVHLVEWVAFIAKASKQWHTMRVRFLVIAICTSLFSTSAWAVVPFMDLINYRAQLAEARGYLPSQHICAMDLRLRSSLRQEVLAEGHDYEWFMSTAQYDASERQTDIVWVRTQQTGIAHAKINILRALKKEGTVTSPWQDVNERPMLVQFGLYPGFYNLASFASYQIGPISEPWYQPNGYVYKVFFSFRSPQNDLTATRYEEFSRRLFAAGFYGDSKIPMIAGWIRFTWNNVIVHALTIKDALIAEKVGLSYFSPWLMSYSRGVDVKNELTKEKGLDWPDFLCVADPSRLPAVILRYVHNVAN